MTQQQIDRQIEAIRIVGAEVLKSKEASRQFLINIGVIKQRKKRKPSAKNK
jgi:hypothetical protein